MNRHKVVGELGSFNLCFRPERLMNPAGVVLYVLRLRRSAPEFIPSVLRLRGYAPTLSMSGSERLRANGKAVRSAPECKLL